MSGSIGAASASFSSLGDLRSRHAATGRSDQRDPAPRSNLPAVIVTTARSESSAPAARPDTALVAQLLAARLDAPQARERRRGEPSEGVAAYAETSARLALARRQTGRSWVA